MKNNQNQSPNIILGLPINNTFAVPRLGNVQLRLHFLRRGTSWSNRVIEYHRYSNEFLGTLDFLITNGIQTIMSPNLITYNLAAANASGSDNIVNDCKVEFYVTDFPISLVSKDKNPNQGHTPPKNMSEQSLVSLISASEIDIQVVLVRDILGRTVKQYKANEASSISINGLNTGIYFVTLVKTNGTTETYKTYSK